VKYGFVAYKVIKDAETAKNEANKSEVVKGLFENNTPFINIFQPKEQRSKFLQLQHRSRSLPHMYQPPMFQQFHQGGFPHQGQDRQFSQPPMQMGGMQ